jgi:hypothetical protein
VWELAIAQRQPAAFRCDPCKDQSSSAHLIQSWLESLTYPERVLGQKSASRVRMFRWSMIEQGQMSRRVEIQHERSSR